MRWRKHPWFLFLLGLSVCASVFFLYQFTLAHSPAPSPTPTTPILHIRGINRQSQFYRQSVSQFGATASSSAKLTFTPKVAVTPHHLLADQIINQTFSLAAHNFPSPRLIILLSPDHFQQLDESSYLSFTTVADWQTPFGQQKGWTASGDISPFLALNNQESFHLEHGIFGLVPFVKYYFPDSQLLPFIIKPLAKNDLDNFDQLVASLKQTVFDHYQKDDILIIASTDFVHQVDLDEALTKNQYNQELLEKHFDSEHSDQIDNDCPQCWRFILDWFDSDNNFADLDLHFYPLANQNSYDFGGPTTDITTYISGFFY